jgi:hypothetical protein
LSELTEEQAYLKEPSLPGAIKTRLRVSERARSWLLLLTIFVAALLPRLLSLSTFMTADEDDQMMFATHFLKSVLHGNFGGALVLGYPGVPTLILGAGGVAARYLFHYMGWYTLPWATADFFTTLDQVTTRFGQFDYPLDFLVWLRVPLVLAATLAIVGIFLMIRRLVNLPVAVIAALLLAFDPFILAHSRIIHVDAPMAYFMFLSFLAFLLFLDNGGWKWLLLSGLFGGLAGLSKTPAAILGPILVVCGVIFALLPPPGQPRSLRWKRLIIALLVWALIAVAAIFALWPSMWSRPLFAINWLVRNVQSVNSGAHPTTGVFWNPLQSDQNPYYYLLVFPFHLTPLTMVGLLFSLLMTAAGLLNRWRNPARWSARMLPLLLSLVVYVIAFIAPVSVIARRGDRYILPVYFAAGLLAALAGWWLATGLIERLPGLVSRLRLTVPRLVGGLLALQIVSVLGYHPYYLAYFNPLVGGPWLAPYYLNVGWGEGMDVAARYMNALTGRDAPRVTAWYSQQFAPYYRGQTIDLSSEQAALTADYAVFYINQVQRGFPSQEILNYFRQRQPAETIALGGIEYAWIYQGPVISQEPAAGMTFPLDAVLSGKARLYGVDVPQTEISADTYAAPPGSSHIEGLYPGYKEVLPGLPVTLYWETLGAIQDSNGKINAFIRLVDDRGNIWGQVDRLILAGVWRPNRWHPGYYLRDEYKLPIDPGTPPGEYHLEVGLYDFVTGQSFGVVKNIGQLTLTPPVHSPPVTELPLQRVLSHPITADLMLTGHTFVDAQEPPGGEIAGKVFWQATGPPAKDYRLEFSFLDPGGKRYIIHEDEPVSPGYPMPAWSKGELVGQGYRFRIPAVAPPGEYPMQLAVVDPDTGQYLGEPVTLARITVEEIERNYTLPANVTPISAVINSQIELVGYKLEDQTVKPRESFGLTLYWRSLDFAAANYTVFVHVVGPDQSIRGQWDSMPAQGASPTSGWLPGEIIADHFEVLMDREAPPWKYDIFVGMYDPVTGRRLELFSPKAPTSDNRVWLTRIQGVSD